MWDQDEEDNNPYGSFQRRESNSSNEGRPSSPATRFDRPSTPPSDGSPAQEAPASSYFGRHEPTTEDGTTGTYGVQRKQGGYDSRVEQILYEHTDVVISITHAGKNLEGGGSYIAYTIKTGDVEVRRRYRDFASLRTTLVNLHPTLIVPPIPEKHSMADYAAKPTKAKEDEVIIEHRKRMLTSFLNRCRKIRDIREDGIFWKFLDPNASWNEVLHSPPVSTLPKSNLKSPPLDAANPTAGHNFLPVPSSTAKLKSSKEGNVEPSGTPTSGPAAASLPSAASHTIPGPQLFGKFPPASQQLSEIELDPYFVNFENTSRELEALLQGDIEKVNRRTLSHLAALSEALSELGARLNSFSLSEQSATLAAAIEKVGQAVDSTYIATGDMSPSLSASFSEPMRESAQFAGIVRSVLRYRILKRVQGEMTRDELEKKKTLLGQLERSEIEAQRIEQHLERSGFGPSTPPRRSNSARTSDSRERVRSEEDTASIDSDFPPSRGDEQPPPSASQGLPPKSEPSSPTIAHKKNGSGNFVTNKIFGRINHAIHGIVDVDPERTRRDQIGKTRESLVQLEQALEVSDKDVKDASSGVLRSLQQFQREKENDLRRYMMAYARVHIDWAKRNIASWEEAKNEVDKIDLPQTASSIFSQTPFLVSNPRAVPPEDGSSSTTSSSKKRKTTYARRGSSAAGDRSDHAPFTTDDQDPAVVSTRASSHPQPVPSKLTSPTARRYLPPHLHDEVFDTPNGSKAAGPSPQSSQRDASRPTTGNSRGDAMTGVERAPEATAGRDDSVSRSETSSPPSSVTTADNALRQLNVAARSSSPAKRSASERDEDDLDSQDGRDGDVGQSSSSPRSPKKSSSQHVSPMPNRFKCLTRPPDTLESSSSGTLGADPSADLGSSAILALSASRPDGSPMSTATLSENRDLEENDGTLDSLSSSGTSSYDEQMSTVLNLVHENAMRDGSKGFVISKTWINRVQSRTSQGLHEPHDKSAREGDVGPVDNSDIVQNANFYGDLRDESGDPFVPLRLGASMDRDFEVVPEPAWDLIMKWYGLAEESHLVVRYARNTSDPSTYSENLQYELFPPICTIQKLRTEQNGSTTLSIQDQDLPAVNLVASRTEPFQGFLKRAKVAARIAMSTKARVWKILETLNTTDVRSGIPTPVSSRNASPAPQNNLPKSPTKLCVDQTSFESMEEGTQRERVAIDDQTVDGKFDGPDKLDSIGFPSYVTLVIEEQIVDSNGEGFISDRPKSNSSRNAANLLTVNRSGVRNNHESNRISTNSGGGRRSPTPTGSLTRGRMNKKGRTRGCTGLVNLGNTCYMNSALQCIRSVEELSIYFLEGKSHREINAGNPLGHGGQIAKAYEELVRRLFSASASFSPQDFRRTLGRCQPLFSGYGQQDSQEFLSFLVDGLHEDLNRVIKKPYIENPESDDSTVHDPEAIKALGEKYRENHKARNDSVAMDLFNGFYKNTMICPVCDKISVTFDPYSLLTLQLPIAQTFQHTVTVARLNGPPVNVDVDMDKNSTIRGLKDYVGIRVGVPGERLVMAEMYNGKFYKVFEEGDFLTESSIQPADKLLLCELDLAPTNWPPLESQKAKGHHYLSSFSNNVSIPDMDSATADRMAIPVVHRINGIKGLSFDLSPSFVLITKEEAQDADMILRKLLRLVNTMTTRDIFEEEQEFSSDEPSTRAASETVVMDDAEAQSSDDQKVQTRSVEGEEGLVDIFMADPAFNHDKHTTVRPSKSNFSKILDPSSDIQPEWRQLFDMKIYSCPGEPIPCGWSTLLESSRLRKLESKHPPLSRTSNRRHSNVSWTSQNHDQHSVQSSDDEDEEEDDGDELTIATPSHHSTPSHVRSSSAESDSDSQILSSEATYDIPRHRNKTVNRKPGMLATFKKSKGKKPDMSEISFAIRLGEGLVLDWSDYGMEQLFGKGDRTFENIATLPDADLDSKRARRAARKKQGVSLEECFEETAKSEILSEDNAWYCGRCKELRRATKKLEIWTVPDILVVHLKRFSTNSRLRDKIDVLVDFPVENLDLDGKVGLPEDKPLQYDLFAVDNHYGGLGGGHYTAYAQNFVDKKWYDYNDQMVSATTPESVVTRAAYLLFYRRRSERALGGKDMEEMVQTANDASSLSGEDSRLDDSLSNGSSNGSHGAGAEVNHQQGAQHHGSAGGHQDPGNPARSGMIQDALPAYDDYDEGIGMDVLPGLEDQHRSTIQPTWGFGHIKEGLSAPPGSSNGNSIAGSDQPEIGDLEDDRLQEFHVDNENYDQDEDDNEVAEIKVSSDNDDLLM